MALPTNSSRVRSAQLRALISRVSGYVSVAYYTAQQAMSVAVLRIGALLLIAVPIAELAVGVDLITTLGLIAPELAVVVAIALIGFFAYRRASRK